ncbi:TRCF domain-containing protein [Pseudoroseomonas wenyumeiae]
METHARLGQILRDGDTAALEDLAEEIEDRFGPPPELVRHWLALARLRLRCKRLGCGGWKAGRRAWRRNCRGAADPAQAQPCGGGAALPAGAAAGQCPPPPAQAGGLRLRPAAPGPRPGPGRCRAAHGAAGG